MKFIKPFLLTVTLILCAIIAFRQSVAFAAVLSILAFGAWLQPEARLGTPTLIVDILTGKVTRAFLVEVPEIAYFSTDFGMSGGLFAQPVKFGQSVISHLITPPVAEAYTPGGGLGTNTTDPKDLLTDVSVAIDQAAKVSIKLPQSDAVKYLLTPAFMETMKQAGIALGRYIIGQAIAQVTRNTFSQEKVATVAGVEYDTLASTRVAMNQLGAKGPRFMLGESNWVKALGEDPVVSNNLYQGQLQKADLYKTLFNIEGFTAIREWPNMPSGSRTIDTFTVNASTNVVTTATAHGLAINDRVRGTTTTTLPGGMVLATDYYVLTAPSSTTLTLSATPGGSVLDITDTGTGTHTLAKFEALNAFAFEQRAIHIGFRPLLDNSDLARMLGIPETSRRVQSVDTDSGLSFTWHLWEDTTGTNPTGDVYATGVVGFGIRAGRALGSNTSPGTQAVGSGMDYAGIRLVETASN